MVEQAALRTRCRQALDFAQGGNILLHQRDLRLGGAQRKIIFRHIAHQREAGQIKQRVLPGNAGIGRFYAAADSAPEIRLPRGIEAGLVKVVRRSEHLRQRIAIAAAYGIQHARARAGFADALAGNTAA